ncbi:hypothetical protein GY26_03340 [Gammaproteobacteria bacterium MFB021]|nr:hypothetical protein GY26_03340 [Gammaproteobacteria bacterium MFB021]
MKRLFLGALLLASLAVGTAHADKLPRYDVEGYCNQVAQVGGSFSNLTYNGCIQMEQSAYNNLKPVWAKLPASMRQGCDDIANVGTPGGSYSTLYGCVQMETNAANNRQSFNFE